jgi:ATP-dependent Lhr-like helicase
MFIAENSIDGNSHVADKLRLEMFQCVAMINLLLKKWNEPADDRQYHFSTLLQQTLSIVASYGGVRANQLWQLLCRNGPFRNINQTTFAKLLQAWGKHELLSQTHDGLLMLGVLGERTVGHFSFYAAFSTPEEYCLEYAGKPLGSIPISFPVWVGQFLVFAGKRWEVLQVAEKEKRIALRPASAGKPPKFGGMGQMLHDAVRLEMFRLYSSEETPAFCDSAAASLLTEGRRHFCGLGLKSASMLQSGQTVHMLPWLGDRATNAIALMLRSAGLNSDCSYGVIDVQDANIAQCQQTIQNILAAPCPDECDLAAHVPNTIIEKWDEYMPTELRAMNYAAKSLDVAGAWHWMLHSGLIRK